MLPTYHGRRLKDYDGTESMITGPLFLRLFGPSNHQTVKPCSLNIRMLYSTVPSLPTTRLLTCACRRLFYCLNLLLVFTLSLYITLHDKVPTLPPLPAKPSPSHRKQSSPRHNALPKCPSSRSPFSTIPTNPIHSRLTRLLSSSSSPPPRSPPSRPGCLPAFGHLLTCPLAVNFARCFPQQWKRVGLFFDRCDAHLSTKC